jgi:hypothetical protein
MIKKYYAVYSINGPIWGVGLTPEKAIKNAEKFLKKKISLEQSGIYLAECSETVFNRAKTGIGFWYIDEGTRPFNCLYLPDDLGTVGTGAKGEKYEKHKSY